MKTYGLLAALLGITVLVFIVGLILDSTNAAYFINGVTFNLVDPLSWLLAIPFALKIRRNRFLLPTLLSVGLALCLLKLYLHFTMGFGWTSGTSIPGNVIGFATVGYIVGSVVAFRERRRAPAKEQAPNSSLKRTDQSLRD